MNYSIYVLGLEMQWATTVFNELSQSLSSISAECIEYMNTPDALVGAGLARMLLNKN